MRKEPPAGMRPEESVAGLDGHVEDGVLGQQRALDDGEGQGGHASTAWAAASARALSGRKVTDGSSAP